MILFGQLPTGQAWTIILGTLGMCLLGIVLVMLSISMVITGDGDTTSTGALFIPGESDDTPASDVQETSQPNTAPQSPPDNQSNRRATLWGLALVFIPIVLYLIFMNTDGFGSYCVDDRGGDNPNTTCLHKTTPGLGIICFSSIFIPIGILVLMQTAIKSIQVFRHNR